MLSNCVFTWLFICIWVMRTRTVVSPFSKEQTFYKIKDTPIKILFHLNDCPKGTNYNYNHIEYKFVLHFYQCDKIHGRNQFKANACFGSQFQKSQFTAWWTQCFWVWGKENFMLGSLWVTNFSFHGSLKKNGRKTKYTLLLPQ